MNLKSTISTNKIERNIDFSQTISEIIQDNSSNEGVKSIALFGSWGSGKTAILDDIKDGMNKDTICFDLDAWIAPDNLVKQYFFETSYSQLIAKIEKIKRLYPTRWFKIEKNKESIRTIETKTDYNIPLFSVFLYMFVFVLIPLMDETLKINRNTLQSVLAALIFIVFLISIFSNQPKDSFKRIVFPFLGGTTNHRTELKEGEDFTPILCKKYFDVFYKDFESIYKDKKLIFFVENIDRLPTLESRLLYLENLYIFMDVTKNYNNVWFVVTSPHTVEPIVDYSYLSAIDKIAPFAVYIAPLSKHHYENYIFQLLSESGIDSSICRKIIKIFQYFKDLNLTEIKDRPSAKMEEISTTYRFLKKFVNTLIICEASSKKLLKTIKISSWELCSYIAAANVFLLDDFLRTRLLKIHLDSISRFNSRIPIQENEIDPCEDKWLKILMEGVDENYSLQDDNIPSLQDIISQIQALAYQEVLPTAEIFHRIIQVNRDPSYQLKNFCDIYSLDLIKYVFIDTYNKFVKNDNISEQLAFAELIYQLNPQYLDRTIADKTFEQIAQQLEPQISDSEGRLGKIIGILYKVSSQNESIKETVWKILL